VTILSHDAGRALSLAGDIYDAALDPSHWLPTLEKIACFVGGDASAIFARDSVNKTGNSFHSYGTTTQFKDSYFNKYIQFDPMDLAYLYISVGDVVSSSVIIPHQEFIETRFYREWVQPQGLIDNVISILEKSATSVVAVSVFRHERDGLVDDAARDRLRAIVPHLRRAVLIGKIIEEKTAHASTFSDTLDGLAAGCFLTDAKGRIVHANAAGHAMLADGDMLWASEGHLFARERLASDCLKDVFIALAGGNATLGAKGIGMPLTCTQGERYVANVLPLTACARKRSDAPYDAAAAIFVHKATLEAPSAPEIIAQTFGLTPQELRVLLTIAKGVGVPDAATALGIAESTVRTHLSQVFSKTGHTRQAQLVSLVAGFSNRLLA
jgi:DNA-binding CsgD family transcriptional regulator